MSSENDVPRESAAIYHLIQLACECNVRGGYTVSDAVFLNKLADNIMPADKEETQQSEKTVDKDSLLRVLNLVERSQSLGKLSLVEAWGAYNAIKILERLPK